MRFRLFLLAAAMLTTTGPARGDVADMTAKGVAFLRGQLPKESRTGELALAALALVKSGLTLADPVVKEAVEKVRSRASDGVYKPDRAGGADNYEAGIVAMLLVSADGSTYRPEIEAVAKYIMSRQTDFGAWDYGSGNSGTTGDTSMTQYAVLGLWEASSVGVEVPLKVWDQAADWLITRQDPGGGFAYHPVKPEGSGRVQQQVTHTMGAGGAGAVLICRTQLPFRQKKMPKGKATELLIPVEKDTKENYEPKVTAKRADDAVELAKKWMGTHLTIDKVSGHGGHCYFLYALERYAELAGLKAIGNADWYNDGVQYLKGQQKPDGSWQTSYAPIIDTSFALLFLGRSTRKTLTRIKIEMLGKGTMLGGRGLPDPSGLPTGLEARRKARYRQALRAPIQDLLDMLDDPDAPAEEAAVALETASADALRAATGGKLATLRRLAKAPKPETRAAALWALAKSQDFRVAPILIAALDDPDASVYEAARGALAQLARRADAFGLPRERKNSGDIAAGRAEAMKWLAQLRVTVEPEQEFDE